MQKLNANTKLQKLKGRRNTKIIAETVEIPNFAEAEDKISLQKKKAVLETHYRKARGSWQDYFNSNPRCQGNCVVFFFTYSSSL